MKRLITQAMILGAGFGTRLRPLTDTIPKVMVPIGGKPLLEHVIVLLRGQGITSFVINIHYLPNIIRSYFGDGAQWGVKIEWSDESERIMDTGGALKKAEHLLEETFLLVYGDHLHRFNFQSAIDFHYEHNAFATLILKRSDLPQNGEVIEIDPSTNKIIAYHTRPHSITEFGGNNYLNSGLYVLSRDITKYIPKDVAVHLDKEIMPKLIASGLPIFGYPTEEDILDVGTPEKYKFAEEWYQARKK